MAAAGAPFELGDVRRLLVATSFSYCQCEGPFKAAELSAAIADAIEEKPRYNPTTSYIMIIAYQSVLGKLAGIHGK